jgi:hypothetical protein
MPGKHEQNLSVTMVPTIKTSSLISFDFPPIARGCSPFHGIFSNCMSMLGMSASLTNSSSILSLQITLFFFSRLLLLEQGTVLSQVEARNFKVWR